MGSNNSNSIYIGVTNDLKKRVNEYKNYLNKGFSFKYNCVNLVYFEKHNSIEKAIKRENPKFYDLAINWNS